MASPSGVGRRRGAGGGLPKQLSSEDQALNLIAKEAEARLAAKRAARAEARSIRMKELERKQKEADELAERSFDEDDEVDHPKKVVSSRITPTATALYNSESPVPAASAAPDPHLKESLREAEDRYRKAMVNNAQLDNERQALQYQVECLKDMIEELEENSNNVKDELLDKTKEFNKLTREHIKTDEELTKCTRLLEDREKILDEHGINLDGTLKIEDDEEKQADNETVRRSSNNQSAPHNQDLLKEFDAERESLLSEIDTLRNELTDLKSHSDPTDGPRRGVDQMKPVDALDLERSFVDVSHSDAARIDNNITSDSGAFPTSGCVNNNEKCEDFEVIDDGSQQGGMRHFEDRSFEQSERSSLLSSVQTNVEESMDSEVPYEISVDLSKQSTRDEYDIVNMGDDTSNKTTDSHNSLTNSNSQDLNINQYFVSDENRDNDGPQTGETFSVDRYFASDDISSVIEVEAASTDTQDELQATPTFDTFVDEPENEMNYDNIEVQDIQEENQTTPKANIISDDPTRCSPYVEVDAEIETHGDVIIGGSINSTISESNENVSDFDEAYIADESQITSDSNCDNYFQIDENTEIAETVSENNDAVDNTDGASFSAPTHEESKLLSTLENDKPKIIKAGYFTTQKPSEVTRPDSLIGNEVNQDVVDFYEQILKSSDEEESPKTNENSLPEHATFGVFGVTERLGSESSENSQTDTAATQSEPHPILEHPQKPQGWLVRVESFNAPKSKAPEIKIVNPDNSSSPTAESPVETPTEAPANTPNPVPKERKKKKKKKRNKANKPSSPDEIQEEPVDAPVPTVPGLLGYEPEPDTSSISAESSPKHRLSDSDIPQQFLDVSNNLASDSLSDLSDIEVGDDGEKKKREGSKKGNKKENCKTQ